MKHEVVKNDSRFLNAAQAAERLGITRERLRQLANKAEEHAQYKRSPFRYRGTTFPHPISFKTKTYHFRYWRRAEIRDFVAEVERLRGGEGHNPIGSLFLCWLGDKDENQIFHRLEWNNTEYQVREVAKPWRKHKENYGRKRHRA